MALVVYNTMERAKVPFVPREEGHVSIYSCGITPYAPTHLGHARQYVLWDVFRRYLVWKGLEVCYVQNFTDIDDKIIAKASSEGIAAQDFAGRYIDEYFEVMEALGVARADAYPKVTEHIGEVVELVESLMRNGVAYEVEGDVYFDVSAMPGYGKLSGRRAEDMEAGARVDIDGRKDDPMDFAVWKAAKVGEPSWDSPWGKGRPGWHIECSAMALKYLGAGFDMHGGGMDLVFPHHENEIAQAEGGTGQPFARYWMHHGFINVNAEKMSKSLGNFKSVKELLARHDPQTIRLFLISTHYRSPISFSDDEMLMSRKGRDRLLHGYQALKAMASAWDKASPEARLGDRGTASPEADTLRTAAARARARFCEAMDDDFNTALAVASLYEFVRDINKVAASAQAGTGSLVATAVDSLLVLDELMGVLGLSGDRSDSHVVTEAAADGAQGALAEGLMTLVMDIRQDARASKNWTVSDRIRDGLKAIGVVVEDTPEGPRWRKADA